jgi:hypothetical protein
VWLVCLLCICAVLVGVDGPLRWVRGLRLDAGWTIREHGDPGLDSAQGWARLHVPLETD